MPRHRTLKSLFLDLVVFVGMFALLGHLSINFWERFVIQNELSSMKSSLHSLKETIYRIGYAYDNLHQELLGLAEIAEKKQSTAAPIKALPEREPASPQSKKKQHSDRQHHKIPLEVLKKTQNHTTLAVPLLINKTIQYYITPEMKKNKTTQNFVYAKKTICCSGKNMSTITRYPPKSTGVGLDYEKCKRICPNGENCKYRKSGTGVHQCCKDFECYNPVYNWKF